LRISASVLDTSGAYFRVQFNITAFSDATIPSSLGRTADAIRVPRSVVDGRGSVTRMDDACSRAAVAEA
jgi:hypothetical protein